MAGLLDPRAWLAALLLVLASYGAGRWHQWRLDQAARDVEIRAQAQLDAAERRRIDTEHQEIVNHAHQDVEAARADAVAASSVSDRLYQHVAELKREHAAAAAERGAPAGDPIAVLADVLARSDAAAGELAAYADAAHIAGSACERAYDALTPH